MRPRRIAARVGSRPAAPTIPAITQSAGRSEASTSAARPHATSIPLGYTYQASNNYFVAPATGLVVNVSNNETETGGIAKLSTSFPFNLSRQVRATRYMFTLASLSRRITRLYVFQWTGGRAAKERFDAGLTNAHSKVRPAYCVIYLHMLHKRTCPYRTAKD